MQNRLHPTGRRVVPTAAAAPLPAADPGLVPQHGAPAVPGDWLAWPEWSAIAPSVLLLALVAWVYALGLARFFSRGEGARLPRRRWLSMLGALIATLVAVASPLDRVAGALFAVHMAQHLVLMLVVAPLLVLARPHQVMLWVLPLEGRRRVGRLLARIARLVEALPAPVALALYGGVLWSWHVPPAYEAAEANALLHGVEHVTMVAAAALFWGRVALLARGDAMAQWRAIPFLIAGMIVGLTLGLGLTWAPQPWYASHLETASPWGLTPREDQQLGGLLMLLPATAVHLGVLGILLARAAAAHDARRSSRPAAARTARPG